MRKLIKDRFEVLLIVAVIMSHAYAMLSPANSLVNWYTTDDAYYYFKVAQNFSEGHGFTFDQIGRTNGFHPLWMLVCIPIFWLARFDLVIPLRLVIGVLALFNAFSGVLIYRILKRVISTPTAGLMAVFWAFFPKVHGVTTTLGMESGINAFFILLFIYQYIQYAHDRDKGKDDTRKLVRLGIIAALMLLSRLDNIFIVIIFGLWMLFPGGRVRFLVMGDLVLAVVSVFLAFLSRLGIDLYYFYSESAVAMFSAGLAIKPLCYYAFGLYQPGRTAATTKNLIRIGAAVISAGILLAGLMVVMGSAGAFPRYPRLALILDIVISLPFILGWHWLGGKLFGGDQNQGPLSALETWSLKDWFAWLPKAVRYFGIPAVTLILYLAANLAYIGTAMPVSGQIKRWWGTMMTVYGKLATHPLDILGLTSDPDLSPWSLLVLPIYWPFDQLAEFSKINESAYWGGAALAGVIYAGLITFFIIKGWPQAKNAIKNLALMPLLVGCFLQISNYKLSGYISLHTWYWIAEMVLTVLFWGVLVEIGYSMLSDLKIGKRALLGISVVLSLVIIGVFATYLGKLTPWRVSLGNEEGYLLGARGLEENTEPGSIIGSTGGGVLGYFTRGRTIVNMDGLISSYPYFMKLRAGEGGDYLDGIGLNYVYGGEYVIKYSEPYVEMFAGRLKYLDHIAGSALFRYLPKNQ